MRMVRADEEGALVAAEVLRAGGVAVVPTDTVYGLAARPEDVGAVRAIYRVKGRPEGMHLPVLAASVAQVRALGVTFTRGADTLARRWWPGPLTLAFGFEAGRVRPAWLDGRTEVAVRIPDHDFLRALLERTGALVVTSANPHGAPTPRTAHDVSTALGTSVDLVVDGGPLEDVPSTLVNVRGADPVVEREGAIPPDAISAALAEAR
jgi:L-threonylcarbamoyladenylate synthase